MKRTLLRWFGAKIGKNVVIKPRVNIKCPWNLEVGDNTWIGENVWIDSLTKIKIGVNCCLSQGVYLCTGNHDWSDPSFGLIVKPIEMEEGAWCGCRAVVLGGAILRSHAIVAANSTLSGEAEAYTIYQGTPAVAIKQRTIGSKSDKTQNPPMRLAV